VIGEWVERIGLGYLMIRPTPNCALDLLFAHPGFGGRGVMLYGLVVAE
jgi:hypothetical protein